MALYNNVTVINVVLITCANTLLYELKEEEEKRKEEELWSGYPILGVRVSQAQCDDVARQNKTNGNADIVSEMIRVNKDLIHQFRMILETIDTSEVIDSDKFGRYCD
ncbi:hypothetical protein FQA39_LY02743 [Lamprigera yunnana]|nr:hypothetical protein FQA39_LY02743 [Lamprigera yunnana]